MATQEDNQPKLREWNIVGGPQKWEFLNAIGDRRAAIHLVEFHLQQEKGGPIQRVHIWMPIVSVRNPTAVDQEAGHRWGFFGRILHGGSGNSRDPHIPICGSYTTKSPRCGKKWEISNESHEEIIRNFL